MTMKILAGVFALALLTSPVFAQTPPVSDADFVNKASIGNMFEMEEAKLALKNATDPRLKGFAKQMMMDHGDAEGKLKDAAGKANLPVATALDQPHQAMLDNLKTFSGKDFDKIYTADQVAAHAETASLLLDYKQNGQNSDLKSWAKKILPIVQKHRATIDAM